MPQKSLDFDLPGEPFDQFPADLLDRYLLGSHHEPSGHVLSNINVAKPSLSQDLAQPVLFGERDVSPDEQLWLLGLHSRWDVPVDRRKNVSLVVPLFGAVLHVVLVLVLLLLAPVEGSFSLGHVVEV